MASDYDDDFPLIYEWLMRHHGEMITGRTLRVHKQVLLGGDFSGVLPADLDKLIQGVRYARANIAAGNT